MKRVLPFLALLLLACSSAAQAPHADWSPETTVAFVNVNVVPMDEERVLRGQTVVVRDGRIYEVGASGQVQVPDGALRIDGRGKYLLPGLAEMHGHLPSPDQPQKQVDETLFLYVANGVTTVRGMLGFPGNLDLRARTARGEVVGPTLYLAGPSFSGGSVKTPEQAAQRVRQQAEEGWDLLKVHPGLTRETYDAMAVAAHQAGIRFAGHVPSEVGLEHAIRMGQETFDHLDGYIEALDGDERELQAADFAELIRMTKAADAWVVPTMPLWETVVGHADLEPMASYPELKYLPASQRNGWIENHRGRLAQTDRAQAARIVENRQRLLRAMNEEGVKILFGTDSPQLFSVPGFSIHHEFLRMDAAGMTPYEILVTGTRNVGDYFRGKDTFGTVAPGRRADLVLVDANPLESIHNFHRISGVMVRGRWLPKAKIDQRLAEIAASYQ